MSTAIHWFRRDLRVSDNASLYAACYEHDTVVPVFIFDPAILTAPETGAPCVAFMLDCLESLQRAVEEQGGRLIIRRGNPVEVLSRLGAECGAKTLYFNRDYEPSARTRDAAVEKELGAAGWTLRTFKDVVIHEADEVLKSDGKPYVVFTPYSKGWRALPKTTPLPKAKFRSAPDLKTESLPLPNLAGLGFSLNAKIPPGGEKGARESLAIFTRDGMTRYRAQRDFPAIAGTSQLSPHLRFGTISPRTVFAAAEKIRASHPAAELEVDTFENELIWREFYQQVLWHFPHAAKSCFRPAYDALRWENNERYFAAWCQGCTGFPIVDAAMRQLNETGWMHNRLRMIVAMFLTKDLLVSWQWGERYFMQKLVDGDLAANNGGWQWSAGTGTDAAPYFRIFNPNSQAAKFDPEGRFIARYVPEAEGFSYPAPIVDHAAQRIKTLAFYKKLQN